MTPNGHLSLLRFLPFFFCIVAPSIGLNCLLAAKNIGPGKEYDKEDLMKELKENYGTVEKYSKFDPSKPEHALRFGKAAAFTLGSEVFKQLCTGGEKCCAELTFSHKSKDVQIFTCSSLCQNAAGYQTCQDEMCNKKDGFDDAKELSEEKQASLVGQAFDLLKEISPEIKAAIEKQEGSQPAAQPTAGGEQTSRHQHLLLILSISYIFM